MSSFRFEANNINDIPDASGMRIGIILTEWNSHITNKLYESAKSTLLKYGVSPSNIIVRYVPGSFELIYGSSQMIKSRLVDAIITLGCVIRGETPHFDYICEGTTQGLASLNSKGDIPVINGVLTVNDEQQAVNRTNGKTGNKGEEFAITAIKMVDFAWQFKK